VLSRLGGGPRDGENRSHASTMVPKYRWCTREGVDGLGTEESWSVPKNKPDRRWSLHSGSRTR